MLIGYTGDSMSVYWGILCGLFIRETAWV